MSASVLPIIFQKRWMSGNFKYGNKFSEHEDYNLIQNFGEYFDTGYGRRYLEDKIHQSNKIFYSKDQFTKRPQDQELINARLRSTQTDTYHRRFPKHHKPKVNSAKEINRNNLELYIKQKEDTQAPNSLNFESELFAAPKPANLIATEPYKQACNHPWKYSYKTINYQTCTERFRRVKSSCVDLSKY